MIISEVPPRLKGLLMIISEVPSRFQGHPYDYQQSSSTISDVCPRSRNRDPQHCLLSQERNPVANNP